jgi:hypothetical protein
MSNIKWTLGPPPYKHQNKAPPYKKVCIGIRGHYGDIMISEPGLRNFIKQNPETKIVFAVSKKYEDILPLFKNYHENIIELKAFEGYAEWPTSKDLEYIKEQDFDAMFPPDIPKHPEFYWPRYRHIVEETSFMIGLEIPNDKKINLPLPNGITKEPKTAAIHMFSSQWPNGVRSIDIPKQELIVEYLKQKGYEKVYQISSPEQPHIKGTIFPKGGTYYEACLRTLSTDILVSCDSGMVFLASAFNHPTLGLYSTAYNQAFATTKHCQPINKNAIYMEGYIASRIPIEQIYEAVDKVIEISK